VVGRRSDGLERFCVAVDLEGYGRRTDAGQEQAQEALAGVLDAAWAAAVPTGALRQPNGDGEVALLPPDAAAAEVLGLLRALQGALHEVNMGAAGLAGDRLRLRAAAHHGVARPARNGFAGDGVVRTCRLLGSRALRGELTARPGADLAVALSDPLFAQLRTLLPVAEFRRVRVVEPAKVFAAWAWVHVGGPLPAVVAPVPPLAGAAAAGEPTMVIEIADGGQAGTVVQARELHGGLVIGTDP
jgi:hypothetical protein